MYLEPDVYREEAAGPDGQLGPDGDARLAGEP
jgi:hypothetical protein